MSLKTFKNGPQKLLTIGPTPFFYSQVQATANSPELIFHIIKCQEQASVLLSVPNMWSIGNLNDSIGDIITFGLLLGANETGKWIYYHEEMFKDIDTNDFSIECIAKKGTNTK